MFEAPPWHKEEEEEEEEEEANISVYGKKLICIAADREKSKFAWNI